MNASRLAKPHAKCAVAGLVLRSGRLSDLAALVDFESRVFSVDLLSARSFRHFLKSPQAAVIVADERGRLVGYALVLFRAGSAVSRLYSIGVSADAVGRGLGMRLLRAAEEQARSRNAQILRLEVQETNAAAVALYRKAGYQQFERRDCYYEDGSPALRYQKPLAKRP